MNIEQRNSKRSEVYEVEIKDQRERQRGEFFSGNLLCSKQNIELFRLGVKEAAVVVASKQCDQIGRFI